MYTNYDIIKYISILRRKSSNISKTIDQCIAFDGNFIDLNTKEVKFNASTKEHI